MIQLLDSKAYVQDLIESIKKAQKHIDLIALVITDDDSTGNLLTELKAAAKRGVKVRIGVDIFFTYKELSDDASPLSYFYSQYKRVKATRKQLVKSGIKVRWLGAGTIFLFQKRTHTKWSIIDDTVYTFGGVNLYSVGIANTDYMFKFEDADLAKRLAEEHQLIINSDKRNTGYKSHQISTQYGNILIDGGLPWDSIIYKRVCQLAEEAEQILYISQYCPTGKLSKIIKRKPTELYFNHWRIANGINRLQILFNTKFIGLKTKYKRKNYLHAKFIIFKMKDGSKIAITGSHNFIWGGVVMGTREIALETKDSEIISQLEGFFNQHIK